MLQTLHRNHRSLLSLSLLGALALPLICLPGQSYGAGFQISEVSVSGLGRAFAGAGVAGDDLSDMFYNPAGLHLSSGRGFQAGLSLIDSQSAFSGTATPFGGPSADGGETSVVPNLFYTFPENGALRFGIGLTAPFGLATEYAANWAGRYQGQRSELTTIDINPALSYKVSEKLSLGAGISAQYADAELSQARFLGPGTPDGKSTVTGDNWGFGFNLGALLVPVPKTRIGLGYRSKIDQSVEGDLTVVSPTGGLLASSGAKAEVSLPETVYLGLAQGVGDRVDLLASVRWTRWSRFEELRIMFDNGLPDSVTEEKWDDTVTLSLGVNYRLNTNWLLRAGYARDESPVSETYRTVRIPDSDRDWFTLGASFKAESGMTLDFGYAYLSGDSASINETTVIAAPPTSPSVVSSNLMGTYDGNASIFGIQLQWPL
jgi:long-chain fatty acid transport protein